MLLETCGHFFDRGSSKRRLDRFLIYFQRYLLSKGLIPLDVEFDLQVCPSNLHVLVQRYSLFNSSEGLWLQDLFAKLRPKMTRYTSFEEVTAAIMDLEEQELKYNKAKSGMAGNTVEEPATRGDISHGGITSSTNGASQFREVDQKNESRNGEMQKQNDDGIIRERESDSDSVSSDGDGRQDEEDDLDDDKYHEHEDEGEEEEEEDGRGDASGSDEEDQVKVKQKKATEIDPAEEAEFERELRAVMQESIDSRKLEIRSRPTLNMVIPMNLFESSKEHINRNITDIESGDEIIDEQDGGDNNVAFRVLVKKGNKQQTRQLHIPRDSSLVQSTKQKEAAELEEKQDIKRRVLEYNDREEDDMAIQQVNLSSSMAVSRGSGVYRTEWEGSRMASSRQRRPPASGYPRRR